MPLKINHIVWNKSIGRLWTTFIYAVIRRSTPMWLLHSSHSLFIHLLSSIVSFLRRNRSIYILIGGFNHISTASTDFKMILSQVFLLFNI